MAARGEGDLANDLRNKRINWCAKSGYPLPLACSAHAGTAGMQRGRHMLCMLSPTDEAQST